MFDRVLNMPLVYSLVFDLQGTLLNEQNYHSCSGLKLKKEPKI